MISSWEFQFYENKRMKTKKEYLLTDIPYKTNNFKSMLYLRSEFQFSDVYQSVNLPMSNQIVKS